MPYIIDTQELLDSLSQYASDDCFLVFSPVRTISPITKEYIHPSNYSSCFIYYRPLYLEHGFIIPCRHSDNIFFGFVSKNISSFIYNLKGRIWTIDKKDLGFLVTGDNISSIKMNYHLGNKNIPEEDNFDTPAHHFFNNSGNIALRNFANYYIPILCHYKKFEDYFNSLSFEEISEGLEYYDNVIASAFLSIEKNIIRSSDDLSIAKPLISKYNLYNKTARPSNTCNGINFMALNKHNGARNIIKARANSYFVEFDYKGYQIKLLADLIKYPLEGDIHQELGKIYFGTDKITKEQYEESKKITFRYAYGRENIPPDVEFFKQVYKLRDDLWAEIQDLGYIVSPISRRKIYNIEKITQVLPYLMQCLETERNAKIILEVNKIIDKSRSRLILYCYDSFLFEIHFRDGMKVVGKIKDTLEEGGYKTRMKFGYNYNEMNIPLIF